MMLHNAHRLAVTIVSLRVYTRAIILHNMGKDDYAMIIALLFTLGYLATIYVLRDNKMGFRLSEVSFEQAVTSLKVTYAIESFDRILLFAHWYDSTLFILLVWVLMR
jgi:hypothetical protein